MCTVARFLLWQAGLVHHWALSAAVVCFSAGAGCWVVKSLKWHDVQSRVGYEVLLWHAPQVAMEFACSVTTSLTWHPAFTQLPAAAV